MELSTAPELIQKFKAKAECFHKDDFSSKVKNSWGELWGESGFLRIRKDGATAHCGLGGKSTFSLVLKKTFGLNHRLVVLNPTYTDCFDDLDMKLSAGNFQLQFTSSTLPIYQAAR